MDGPWFRSLLVCALVTIACGPGAGSTTSASSSDGSEGTSTTAAPLETGTTTAPEGTSTSNDGASSGSSSGGVSPPDCSDYMGRATPEQTAMTPLADAEAELLAIEASGEIVAPPALHDRIVGELAAIRGGEPGLADVLVWPDWSPSAIVVSLDEEGMAAYDAGTYQDWDCPNALYHVMEIEPGGLFGAFTVRFAGLYDVNQVLEDYLVVEHVEHAEIEPSGGDASDVCLSIDGDLHTYIFDDARGDCPAGCTEHLYTGFTVDIDGTITPLGSFDPAEPVPVPAWFEAAESCTMWL
jgi:hypothetical protein